MHAADGCRAGVATDLLHSRALRAMHEDDISHKPEVCFGVEPLLSLLQPYGFVKVSHMFRHMHAEKEDLIRFFLLLAALLSECVELLQ